MKVDTSRLKKGTSEVPPECQLLIDRLRQCTRNELINELSKIETWTFGKCELYHWIDILDIFDGILEEATQIQDSNEWCLACDMNFSKEDVKLLLLVLNFTTLLIEHSFSRHLYNSVEHLTRLLSSSNMDIVLGVLNLLYMFSKRSNFISRLNSSKKNSLLTRLNQIAESWGGKEYGFGLANCCKENTILPESASTFFYEYYDNEGTLQTIEVPNLNVNEKHPSELTKKICEQIEDLDDDQKMHIFTRIRLSSSFHKYSARLQFVQARLQALSVLVYSNSLQENIHTLLYPGFLEELVELLEMKDTHLVEIRAAALRTLTSIIHLDRNPHFPKKPGSRLGMIIDVTGAAFYHGFLPTLVRTCIQNLTTITNLQHQQHQQQSLSSSSSFSSSLTTMTTTNDDLQQQQKQLQQLQLQQQSCSSSGSNSTKTLQFHQQQLQQLNPFPLPLATALFSFLYHLSSYESGGEALVSCGMMESLLRVINWPGCELEHITFVTRAVRVIDLITNIEMQSFQNHGGLNSFIGRLDMEVNFCRREQPFEIEPQPDFLNGNMDNGSTSVNNAHGNNGRDDSIFVSDDTNMSTDDVHPTSASSHSSSSYSSTAVKVSTPNLSNSLSFEQNSYNSTSSKTSKNVKTCLPQRAALLKSMLNFLKKAIQDAAFSDSIRHVMEGTLPSSLRHIISNAEYYGPSLFLLATDVVTVYVFQEPSLLSSLQDNGLTDVVLQALLKKDVPATREVLGSLPNVFSALCLNSRGLASFVKYEPFERLFKVLLSPVYLMAMRRRRNSDPMGDTASNLGNAMDELMRHQPSLKPEAIKGIIKLLEELVRLGTDPKYICWRATTKNESSVAPQSRPSNGNVGNDAGSSDEEEDDEEEASTSSHHNQREESSNQEATTGDQQENSERTPIPLIDYILNVMKFVDAILSNNSTDDHCREFVAHGGLKPLLSILALPNLPVDSPITASAQAVAAVCKSILNLAHEPQVLQVALEQLAIVVDQLKPLQTQIESPGGSVLLRELANCPNIDAAFSNASYTPLLHGMSAVHGYVVMLVHICRTGQNEIRNLLLTKWGQDTRYGKKLLKNLVQLYTSLVWESTVLLALCTDDIFPYNCEFGKEDIEKLPSDPADDNITIMSETNLISVEKDDNTMDMEPETNDSDEIIESEEGEKKKVPKKLLPSPGQLKYIKALLGASSRLGRALAELFGNLVKLCVGSPIRQRRGQNFPPTPGYTRAESKYIARVLSYILVDGFTYDKLPSTPIPKLKLTFLICSVGFTGPMLFDEKRYAFHLMLHKFVEEGGLEAFFEMFCWALTAGHTMPFNKALEVQHFPDGTGEFLDAWLMLLEKMVNPKAILESPHVINTRGGRGKSEFDAALYLINVHRLAFEAVTQIWGMAPLPTYGVRMTESIMTIFKHILKGEKIIKEKMKKRFVETTESTDKELTGITGGTAGGTGTGGNSSSGGGGSSSGTRTMSPMIVNQSHLLQLMDMGFSREHVTEALMHTVSVEQATEYLLNHPPPPPLPPVTGGSSNESEGGGGTSSSQQGMDIDGDDEQVNRAIMLSLENGEQSKQRTLSSSSSSDKSSSNRRKSSKYQLTTDPPIPEDIFVDFSTKAVDKCLRLMDQLPDTVVKGTELLAILYRKNDDAWGVSMLDLISSELKDSLEKIMKGFEAPHDANFREKIYYSILATKFQVRLHIFCLFLDEMYADIRIPAIRSLKKFNVISDLVNCLRTVEVASTSHGLGGTPKWLAQMIIFLDLYEKVAVYAQRKAEMHRITTRVWKWYDVASGKWNAYSMSNNKIINDAYWSGESCVRISCGRQRYSINFNCMSQVNEETGNHRPVILALKATELRQGSNDDPFISLISDGSDADDDDDEKRGSGESGGNGNSTSRVAGEAGVGAVSSDDITDTNVGNSSNNSGSTQKKKSKSKSLEQKKESSSKFETDFKTRFLGLEEYDTCDIVSCLVRLMSPNVGVDRDTLHAIMKLLVRLTKSFENAEVFALEGGVRRLLSMKQTCGYVGFPTLSILLIRHVLEEPKTLALAMERVIAARTMQTIPPGYRDLVFLLRQMSSAVSRDPKTFLEVAQSMLRIDISVLRRNLVNEDHRLLLKSIQTTKRTETMEEPISIQVVHDLLNALIVPWPYQQQQSSTNQQNCSGDQQICQQDNLSNKQHSNGTSLENTITSTVNAETNTSPFHHIPEINPSSFTTSNDIDIGGNGISNQNSLRRQSTTRNRTANSPDNETGTNNKDHCCAWHIGSCVSHEHDKPLLPRARILKFLADAVRSYQTFAPLITEHVYKAGDSPIITENTTALSFIIDKLLPVADQLADREVSSMSRVLISALASCSEQTSVQYTVVSEVKAAITRALALPECVDKHSQLQMLAGLIPIMIDNCPLENPALVKLHNLQPRRSDIFYIMVRKGLITDLAKLTQYLDLSSPHTIATVNAAMKPLETLLRMTNQPGPVPMTKSKKTQSRRGNNTSNDDLQPTSRIQLSRLSESDFQLIDDQETQDQDMAVGGGTASEHHLSHSHSQSHSGRTRVNLNEIMEQILERVENERTGEVEPREDNVDDFNPRAVVLETSSESADSESNGSDNDEREIDDEDENEEEGEDRSEIDVDEETRQFIEIYDHVYGRHLSPDLMTPAYSGMVNPDQVENDASNALDRIGGTVGSNDRTGNSNAPGSPGRLMAFQVNIPNIFESITNNRPILTPSTSVSQVSVGNSSGQPSSNPLVSQSATIGDRSGEPSIINDSLGDESSSSNLNQPRIRININSGAGSSSAVASANLPAPTATSNTHQHHHHHHHAHPCVSGSNSNTPNFSVSVSTSNQQQVGIPSGVANSASQISTGNGGSQAGGSSIPQRLVFTRTLRTQLGASDGNTSNVRQRRYQLLSLNSRNTPIILQRLLGPGNTAQTNSSSNAQESNEVHNSNSSNNNAFRDATRVILMDNAFGIFSNTDEGSIDLVDQTGYLFGRSLAATLSSTPTALHWWLEEAKALGLESQSDICLTVANSLIPQLEMQKSLELSKIRGKKKKKIPEDDPELSKFLDEHNKRAKEENPSQMTPLERVRNLAFGVNRSDTMSETQQQQQPTRQQQSSGNSMDQSQTTSHEEDTSQISQQNQQQNGPRSRYEMYSDLTGLANTAIFPGHDTQFIDSEDVDNALMNQEQRNTTNATNDVMSATSPSDFVSDTEHSLPDTTLLQDDEENEEENDDDDEEEDDEEDDDDEDEIVNNSSDEQEESSEVGEDVYNLYNQPNSQQESARPPSLGHNVQSQQQLCEQSQQQPPQTQQNEQNSQQCTVRQQQQTLLNQNENNDRQNGTNDGTSGLLRHVTNATETNTAGGNDRQGGVIDEDENLPSFSIVMGSSSVSLLSPPTPARQSITEEEEMAAAVLIPLPIDDDDDEELDDILEILDHTTSLGNNTSNSSTVTNTNTENMTSAPMHSDDLDILDHTSNLGNNTTNSAVATNNANATMMPTMNEDDDEELDDILEILDHTTSISNNTTSNTAVTNTNLTANIASTAMQISPSSTVIDNSAMTREGQRSSGNRSNETTTNNLNTSVSDMADESLTNRQNRTNENQEEEGAVGGILNSLTTNSNTNAEQQQQQIIGIDGEREQQQESNETQQQQQGIDNDTVRNLLGDLEVPEGVDPSFLAALPYEMREEVIAEHLRLQRIRQRAQQNAIQVEQSSVIEVNPEFLAALPPNIQEEVLAQQRIEQQRQAAATANPNDPVDAAAFFQNLQPSLRQAILTDMEDSQISVLPPELAAEAQNLRRDWENRNRQMMEERLLNQIGSSTPNIPSVRYLYRRGPRFPGHVMRPRWTNWNVNGSSTEASSPSLMTLMERQGRPLLDHEALTSLLTLLFIDEPKFNTLRLHRVIRNLCCHVPTREWIIKALLSIIERCNCTSNTMISGGSSLSSSSSSMVAVRPQWLNIRLNAALGSRANVFVIKKDTSRPKRNTFPPEWDHPSSSKAAGALTSFSPSDYIVSIHPQASQIVCKHTLDLLITLAKSFPKNFLPYKKQPAPANVSNVSSGLNVAASTSSQQTAAAAATITTTTTTTTTAAAATTTTTAAAATTTTTATATTGASSGTVVTETTTVTTANISSETEKPKKILNTSSSSSSGNNTIPSTSASSLPDNDAGSSSLNSGSNGSSGDFWDIIVKLDCTASQRKIQGPLGGSASSSSSSNTTVGGSPRQPQTNLSSNELNSNSSSTNSINSNCSTSNNNKDIVTFDESPFGQLISMLSYDIVRKSSQLTDKLLRLLSFISVGLPDEKSTTNISRNTTSSSSVPSSSSSSGGVNTASGSTTTMTNTEEEKKNDDEMMDDTTTTATTINSASINESLLPNSENQLRLAIEVLTSKSCSEEGLEDATSLLLNMSQCSNQTRTIILNLLIRGAKDLARMVQQQIKDLMNELKELNHRSGVNNSFATPSSGEMSPEDSTLLASTSNNSSTVSNVNLLGSSSAGTTIGVNSGGGKSKGMLQDRFTKETVVITAPTKVKQTCELQLPSMVPLISKTSSQGFFLRVLKVIIQIREAVREANGKIENRGRIVLGPNELTPLSETLDLDDLWDTLSECLLELEDTADNHAVLVLQPAVEAFFLVHASTTQKLATASSSVSRQSQNRTVSQFDNIALIQDPDIDFLQAITTTASSSIGSRFNINSISTTASSASTTTTSTTATQNVGTSEMTSSLTASNADYPRPMQQDDDDLSSAGGDTTVSAQQSNISINEKKENSDQKKFLQFAEKHRTVLNQILRQTTTHLADGPFAVLVDHTRILDFDVKRRYFRTELERLDEGIRREELAVHVHRVTVFEDSFRELYRRNPEEWKNRFYIVFEDEEGQDAGGLLREWYVIISREIFNPMYALFTVSPGDRVTYMINPSSHANPNHLCYYKFVGRVIAKAIYDNKLLECYFTRSFYKHILGIQVKYTDMESEDYDFYKGLVFLLENHISALGYELTFSLEVQEFGVTEIRDLIPNGRNIPVTEDNKLEYIHLVCQLKMSGSIRQQLNAFLEGFYDIIPKRLISIFNEQELELLISGLPNVDIEDLKANTEYHKYQANSIQIQWFWRALRSFDQADRAKFLQFVTGTSKVPLQGFGALEGMNGTQKFQIHRDDRSTDRLPSAHTCFNQLDLPVYKTYDKLRSSLLKAIHECSEGFGFA